MTPQLLQLAPPPSLVLYTVHLKSPAVPPDQGIPSDQSTPADPFPLPSREQFLTSLHLE